MAKTSASYTIMDYNDGISILSKITSNHPDTLAFDPTTGVYNPSWATSPLTLTPTAYVAGRSTDLIPSATIKVWSYRRTGETAWTIITSGTGGFTIATTTSVLSYSTVGLFDASHPTLEFQFKFSYLDTTLNITFAQEVVQAFTRISNGTSVVIARVWSEAGETIKNNTIPASILLHSELVRGATSDATLVSYIWQKYIGGTWTAISGATSVNYTVTSSTIDGLGQFRCIIKDNDPASDTINVSYTSNGISIVDLTDPYQAVITSDTGSFIKNGSGLATLTCLVYQNGVRVTSGLTYHWSATDANGVTLSLGATVVNTSTLNVTSSMIDVKANFTCEVS